MGQQLSTVVGYVIVFYLKILNRAKSFLDNKKEEKSYYRNDITIKDEEQQAGNYFNK